MLDLGPTKHSKLDCASREIQSSRCANGGQSHFAASELILGLPDGVSSLVGRVVCLFAGYVGGLGTRMVHVRVLGNTYRPAMVGF